MFDYNFLLVTTVEKPFLVDQFGKPTSFCSFKLFLYPQNLKSIDEVLPFEKALGTLD